MKLAHELVMHWLINEKGFDINTKLVCGRNILHECVRPYNRDIQLNTDRYELMTLMLEFGADMKKLGLNMSTALHHAAFHNDLLAAQILIDAGIDVNAFDSSGRTAIDFTCYEPMQKLLTKHGSKPSRLGTTTPETSGAGGQRK